MYFSINASAYRIWQIPCIQHGRQHTSTCFTLNVCVSANSNSSLHAVWSHNSSSARTSRHGLYVDLSRDCIGIVRGISKFHRVVASRFNTTDLKTARLSLLKMTPMTSSVTVFIVTNDPMGNPCYLDLHQYKRQYVSIQEVQHICRENAARTIYLNMDTNTLHPIG